MPEYVFQNLEDSTLEFTTFTIEGKQYSLKQNQVVDLTEEIAEHLNSISYPNYVEEYDKEKGGMTSVPGMGKRRFSVTPASTKQKQKRERATV
jgi:hypothetical protein